MNLNETPAGIVTRNEIMYLLKLGELTLKGGNRAAFERALLHNFAVLLRGTGARIIPTNGRFFVYFDAEKRAAVEDALDHLFGITGWAEARRTEKTPAAVLAACVEEARCAVAAGARSFKVESRRTDKSFPLESYRFRCAAGDAVTEALPGLRVDVRTPDVVINVEIRERAYIYGFEKKGRRGLPVGTAGRGLLLLSGGIDSPVAGYMMASRGMGIDAVHFHAYPYTSEEARQKVARLAEIVGRFSFGIRLFAIGFTDVQLRIKEKAPPEWGTVLLRMAMMEAASALAKRRKCKCLISGESLGQVASQTIENMACTESRATLPVMRPLIGMDKEAIIKTACSIGTYETSILPFEDCCTLFTPPHPILHGKVAEATALYESLDLQPLLAACGNPALS